jgi:hypothetical protein
MYANLHAGPGNDVRSDRDIAQSKYAPAPDRNIDFQQRK